MDDSVGQNAEFDLPELNITEEEFEHWFLTEVVPEYDAMRADPSLGTPAEEVFASLRARLTNLLKAERDT